jgi:hypothetical protein
VSENRLQFPDAVLSPPVSSYSAFGVSIQFATQLTLDVRLKTGARIGLPYPWLSRTELNPPELLLAFTTGLQLSVKGRNLTDIYQAIICHQAVYICEADAPTQLLIVNNVPVIELIEIKT